VGDDALSRGTSFRPSRPTKEGEDPRAGRWWIEAHHNVDVKI
jgi:hypothetical protein